MSLQIPPSRLPMLLRGIAWVYLVVSGVGVVRLAHYLVTDSGEFRLSRLFSSLVLGWSAFQVRRGHRDGLVTLLWLHGLAAIALPALLFTDPDVDSRLWIVVALVWAGFAYLYHCMRSLPWRNDDREDGEYEQGSYGHWLTDSSFREGAAKWFAMRDAQLAADEAIPPDPRMLLADMLDSESVKLTKARIRAQKGRMSDAVVEALGDPRYQEDESLLYDIVSFLADPAPPEAAPALAECSLSMGGVGRGAALRALASTGDPQFVDVLLAGLQHTDTACDTARGLASAFSAGRRDRAVTQKVRGRLRWLMDDEKASYQATRALLGLEAGFAGEILRDVDISSGARLGSVRAAGDLGVPLPPGDLLPLWRRVREERVWNWVAGLLSHASIPRREVLALRDELESQLDREDTPRAYRAVLERLVADQGPAAEPDLRRAVELDLEEVSVAAAELLCELRGLPRRPWVDYEMPLEQIPRYHCCLSWAASFACNGGLIKAFECLNEDNTEALEPALTTIAPPDVGRIWIRAIRLLAEGPLPRELDARHELIADRYSEVSDQLNGLSAEFFAISHRLDVCLLLLAAEHADEIRPVLAGD